MLSKQLYNNYFEMSSTTDVDLYVPYRILHI